MEIECDKGSDDMTCKDFYAALSGSSAEEFRYVDKRSGRDAPVVFFGETDISTPAVEELKQAVSGQMLSIAYIKATWNPDGSKTVVLKPVQWTTDPEGVIYASSGNGGNFLISGYVE